MTWRSLLAVKQAIRDLDAWLFDPWPDGRPWSDREHRVRTELAEVILRRTIERDEAIEVAELLRARLAETERLLELVRGNPAMAAGMQAMRDKLTDELAARDAEGGGDGE